MAGYAVFSYTIQTYIHINKYIYEHIIYRDKVFIRIN